MNRAGQPLAQPLLGILATVISVGASLLFVTQFSPATMATWLTLGVTSCIPLQFLIAIEWHNERPAWIARFRQPWRGLLFCGLFAVFGAGVSVVTVLALGGGVAPPTPFATTYVIYAVMITLWVMVGFGSWPLSLLRVSPIWRGIGTLLLAYLVTLILYRLLFNFEHLHGAPFYDATLDPRGLFIAWAPQTLTMTSVAVLLTSVYFDFLPMTLLVRRLPALGRQPLFGLLLATFCGGVGSLIWWVGIHVLHIDLVIFLARVDVAYIFGVLSVMNLFQMAPFVRLPQPWRGAALTLASVLLAGMICPVYVAVSCRVFGCLSSGAPTYDLELWMASALLGITFPLMTLYSGSFQFWPLAQTRPSVAHGSPPVAHGG